MATRDDPFRIFESWYEDAGSDASPSRDAVALATAAVDARPSVRMVYYRGLREGGFSFFTNYESRKGRELAENPFAAMIFYWAHIGRQLRIEGRVERLSDEESDRYFAGRRLKSQISALVSKQSRPIEDEAKFLQALDKAELVHQNQQVSRPDAWGGFKLIPSRFEFWTRGEHRRHRRIVYDEHEGDWRKSRLYP